MKFQYFLIIIIILLSFNKLSGQLVLWEEDFENDPGTWELDDNWYIASSTLTLNHTPEIEDYDLSATSPSIYIPGNAEELRIAHWIYDNVDNDSEYAEVWVIADEVQSLLWQHEIEADLGQSPGIELMLPISEFAGQNVQLRFRSYGANTYNINKWNINNIELICRVENDLKVLSLDGSLLINLMEPAVYSLNVQNIGLSSQENFWVLLQGPDECVLVTAEYNGTIAPGDSAIIPITWTPPFDEFMYPIYGAVLLDGDQVMDNNSSDSIWIHIEAHEVEPLYIGNGNDLSNNYPINVYYWHSFTQTLYYPDEVGDTDMLLGISYFNDFTDDLEKPVTVWVGETAQSELTEFIPISNLQMVYSGNLKMPKGENIVSIEFDVPYSYMGDNLVIAIHRQDIGYYSPVNQWYVSETPEHSGRTAEYHVDGEANAIDIYDLPFPDSIGCYYPNTVLHMLQPPGLGTLYGEVRDTLGEPINNALIKIVDSGYYTYTNENGFYSIPFILCGEYDVKASKQGYINSTAENVVISPYEEIEQNFVLMPCDSITVSGTVMITGDTCQPAVGAFCTLTGGVSYAAETDGSGEFIFENVYSSSEYVLDTYYQDNQILHDTIVVSENDTTIHTVYIERDSLDVIHVNGEVAGVWANDTVKIVGEITIPNGETLTIEPGTYVEFQGHYKLNVDGCLLALGTEEDSITFTINDTTGFGNRDIPNGGWHGIRFDSTSIENDSSVIAHCILEYCKSFGDYPEGSGGAIFICDYSKISIINSRISHSSAIYGGGVYCGNTSAVIQRNIFTNNYADYGGGILMYESTTRLYHNTFIDNLSWYGGGIHCKQDESSIIYNKIFSNYANDDGGGLFGWNSNAIITNNMFVNNISDGSGGGIALWSGWINEVQNNFITNNQSHNGGGIYCSSYFSRFLSNTIANNYADEGGGIYCYRSNLFSLNNIIYRNTINEEQGNIFISENSSPRIYYCDIQGGIQGLTGPGVDNLPAENYQYNIDEIPMFINPSPYVGIDSVSTDLDWALMEGSPCIDAGTPSGWEVPLIGLSINELLGYEPIGGSYDIGAFESNCQALNQYHSINKPKELSSFCYPNPFNPTTTISFYHPQAGPLSLSVYNIKGQLVKSLIDSEIDAGQHSIVWQGNNDYNKPVASGIYFYTLQNKNQSITKKIILMK